MIRSEFFPRSYLWQAITYGKKNLETPLATLNLFLHVSLGLIYHFALTGLSMDLTSAPALLLFPSGASCLLVLSATQPAFVSS